MENSLVENAPVLVIIGMAVVSTIILVSWILLPLLLLSRLKRIHESIEGARREWRGKTGGGSGGNNPFEL